MNKKRALSILMAAAMAAGTLVTSVPVYADDVEEITWMFWDDLEATEDLISKGYKEVIDRFNEEYDGKYHVTPITTNLEEYDGKLNALIAAGQTPDVYICNPGPNMDVYVNAGAAADCGSSGYFDCYVPVISTHWNAPAYALHLQHCFPPLPRLLSDRLHFLMLSLEQKTMFSFYHPFSLFFYRNINDTLSLPSVPHLFSWYKQNLSGLGSAFQLPVFLQPYPLPDKFLLFFGYISAFFFFGL